MKLESMVDIMNRNCSLLNEVQEMAMRLEIVQVYDSEGKVYVRCGEG